ncbi:MAG: hypothetical protein II440_00825, partial [Clostridia bacterium]|nr:hypothetical protein [Clostridia bacterium]
SLCQIIKAVKLEFILHSLLPRSPKALRNAKKLYTYYQYTHKIKKDGVSTPPVKCYIISEIH